MYIMLLYFALKHKLHTYVFIMYSLKMSSKLFSIIEYIYICMYVFFFYFCTSKKTKQKQKQKRNEPQQKSFLISPRSDCLGSAELQMLSDRRTVERMMFGNDQSVSLSLTLTLCLSLSSSFSFSLSLSFTFSRVKCSQRQLQSALHSPTNWSRCRRSVALVLSLLFAGGCGAGSARSVAPRAGRTSYEHKTHSVRLTMRRLLLLQLCTMSLSLSLFLSLSRTRCNALGWAFTSSCGAFDNFAIANCSLSWF